MRERDEEFERAFDELFVLAWRAAMRIVGDPTAAQDVAAETLTRAYVHWSRAAPFAEAWVVRVATNLAIDGWRRQRRSLLPQPGPAADPAGNAVESADLAIGLRALPRRHLPDAAKGEVIGAFSALAWLDDGRRLGVLTSTPGGPRQRCVAGVACPTTTTQPPTTSTSHVLVLDPEVAGLGDARVHPAPVGTDWTFLARGPQPGTLVVTGIPVARGPEYATSISLITPDGPDRQIRPLGTLSPFSNPDALDASGQHLLYRSYLDDSGLFRRSIVGDAPPVRLGDGYINASW